jgi:hypothetical protein
MNASLPNTPNHDSSPAIGKYMEDWSPAIDLKRRIMYFHIPHLNFKPANLHIS